MLDRTVKIQLNQLFLHSELVKTQGVPQIGDEGRREDLLHRQAVSLHVELAYQPLSPLVDHIDERAVPSSQDRLVVHHSQRFPCYFQLVLCGSLEIAVAKDCYLFIVKGAKELVCQVGCYKAAAFGLDSFGNFKASVGLIEIQGYDLIGVVDEVQNQLTVQSQQLGDLCMFVIRTRVLLQKIFVEQVIDEDVAVFICQEQILPEDLHVCYFRAYIQRLWKSEIFTVVKIYDFRSAVEGDELIVSNPLKARIDIFRLNVFIVSNGLLLELTYRWLGICNRRNTWAVRLAYLFENRAYLVLLLQKQGDFGSIKTQLVQCSIAVVDGLSQDISELLVQVVVWTNSSS